jgi:hypothetical protein
VGIDKDWIFIVSAEGSINNGSVNGFHSLGIIGEMYLICGSGNNFSGQLGDTTNANKRTMNCNAGNIALDIPENSLELEWQTYPNPTKGLIKIESSSKQYPIQLRIINMEGRLIQENLITNRNASIFIEGRPGLYFLEIIDFKGNYYSKKVIKQL